METSKMISFYWKKVKPFHKYCPTTIGTPFSTEFLLDAKV